MSAFPIFVMSKFFNHFSKSQLDIILSGSVLSFVVFLDRITKSFMTNVLDYGESLPVIQNVFHFTLVHNTGIAFGLFKDNGIVFFITPIVALILLFVNVYYYLNSEDSLDRVYITAFAMILGGAIGNLIDRMVFGYVIDFFDFRIWPVFNIADCAITVGATIIALKCFQLSSK